MLDPEQYNCFRVSPLDPITLRCEGVESSLKNLAERSGGRLTIAKFDESFSGRPIYLATLGTGSKRILLWSQMHGDEPTHTAVLLDLMSYLTRTPAELMAAEILANCTLLMIPMLNPDGAAMGIRHNSQHIDINRDAARLQTPEGRALRRAFDTLNAKFGFNLHNQNARAAVGKPARPIAVAVLTPGVHPGNAESEQVHAAKQIAATFTQSLRPFASDLVARYLDDFSPWCFGDAAQLSGLATILVEAGGWPDVDPAPQVELHFRGLLATLHAIATDSYQKVDSTMYDALPAPNDNPLLDFKIAGGHVFDPTGRGTYRADLAINHSHGSRLKVLPRPDGKIEDVGDLDRFTGKQAIGAVHSLIIPGRVAVAPEWDPAKPLPDDLLTQALTKGVTTLIGVIDLNNLDSLNKVNAELVAPVHWGFVARLVPAKPLTADQQPERIALALAHGALAVVADDKLEPRAKQLIEAFGVPLLQTEQLPSIQSTAKSYEQLANDNWTVCELFDIKANRGRLRRDYVADLQLFELGDNMDAAQPIDWGRLARVIVSGGTVWAGGMPVETKAGKFLHRQLIVRPA